MTGRTTARQMAACSSQRRRRQATDLPETAPPGPHTQFGRPPGPHTQFGWKAPCDRLRLP